MQNLMAMKPNYLLLSRNELQFVSTSTINNPTLLIFFLLISLLPLQVLFAQDSTSYEIIKLESVKSFSIDRYENIYLVNDKQDVKKQNDDKHIYSSKKRKNITHLEASNSLKLFLFNQEYQEFTLLDKYLTHISTTTFNQYELGFISYATLALDGNIWTIDNADFSLKKLAMRNNKTIVTTNLNFILEQTENEILFMKENGNYLYVCTKNSGILVFDNLGTYKKKLPYNTISFIGFKDNEMYFVNDFDLTFFNLITLETKKELLPFSSSKALIVKDKLYLIE